MVLPWTQTIITPVSKVMPSSNTCEIRCVLNVEIIEEIGQIAYYFVCVCQERNILFLLYLSQWIDVLLVGDLMHVNILMYNNVSFKYFIFFKLFSSNLCFLYAI